jgi:hypothetical protein
MNLTFEIVVETIKDFVLMLKNILYMKHFLLNEDYGFLGLVAA